MANTASLLSPLAKRLEGKIAIITGGTGTIGAATVKLFNQHGAKVVIADLNKESDREACKQLDPEMSTYMKCDMTNEEDVKQVVDETVSKHGRLDIMFNNAAIVDPPTSSIIENKLSDFNKTMSINVIGVFLGIKHAARVMIPNGGGNIINTSSICSIFGGMASHGYTSSKHGVVGLTKSAAVELGYHGIRVNAIAPYVVPTCMSQYNYNMSMEELAKKASDSNILRGSTLWPEDIARAALFLASEESRYMNGHNLVVDGGYTITHSSSMDAFSTARR